MSFNLLIFIFILDGQLCLWYDDVICMERQEHAQALEVHFVTPIFINQTNVTTMQIM